MKCPNCVLGDLHLFIRGQLRFQTDAEGRPCGTADITTGDRIWIECDTCRASFGVQGWRKDGAGMVILTEQDQASDDAQIEMEPESPPPGAQRVE